MPTCPGSSADILWTRVQTQVPTDDDAPPADLIPAPAKDSAAFALEKYLQEFLIENWAQTALGGEWELLEDEDGDLVGSYYKAGVVGEIDLLAKHKTGQRWLVIELKRRQTSDATVGQRGMAECLWLPTTQRWSSLNGFFGMPRNIGLRSSGGRNNRKLAQDRWAPSFELRGLPTHLSLFSLGECFVQQRFDVGLVRQTFLFSLISGQGQICFGNP